jgi:hypothetical protein
LPDVFEKESAFSRGGKRCGLAGLLPDLIVNPELPSTLLFSFIISHLMFSQSFHTRDFVKLKNRNLLFF